ncbi:pyridoxamine 5'-phosphate oxidase family protein [Gordonia asplenii]|nr:pyridoxamine 5'-phosphate oxidase family protein [Gordonia asplenii]
MSVVVRVGAAASAAMRRWAIRRSRHDDPTAVLAAARAIMRSRTYCVLVTHDDDGPSARVVQPHKPDDRLCVHIGTSPMTRKAQQLNVTRQASLVYLDEVSRSSATIRCVVEPVSASENRRRFMSGWSAFWPDGPESADFAVFRCVPNRIEIWDLRRGITPPPFGLASAVLERSGAEWVGST